MPDHIEADRNTLLSPVSRTEEQSFELTLRPQTLHQYIGQPKVKENISISIQAARKRGEALDHVLLYGPPGLGKTTLATIIANELKVNIRATSGPIIEKRGDLAAILTNLKANDVLFVDEIHRLHPAVEEILYPAMEDFHIDVLIGHGPTARSIRLTSEHTTLVGSDVLFVDEIHRLHPAVEEILYPAMEDFHIDVLIGQGPSARSIRL